MKALINCPCKDTESNISLNKIDVYLSALEFEAIRRRDLEYRYIFVDRFDLCKTSENIAYS